jgi:hypothetical protein
MSGFGVYETLKVFLAIQLDFWQEILAGLLTFWPNKPLGFVGIEFGGPG